MGLTPGTRFGPYEVVSPLGVGGMGEVYRAHDSRLKRDVALKVLPAAVAEDTDRHTRFRREAQVLASMNHPNIAAIYGLEESDSVSALILELVEGETLADRIARGALSEEEALRIAGQIGDALESAHDRGIIHRDLKPSNIALAAEGTVKVLDFGLAKILGTQHDLDAGSSPTMTGTTPGMILGTAYYMSPEQATGREADRAADVWAFGCVLYEMLTGRRAFEGATAGDVLASVLKTEPDWQRLPERTPESIRRLLRRSLEKDVKLRLRDIRDARLEIADAKSIPPVPPERRAQLRRGERWAWAAGVALLCVVCTALVVRALRPVASAGEVRLEDNTPTSRSALVAVSPDGSTIVSLGVTGGIARLWLRPLASSSARPLAGTERAMTAFWKPDSRSLAFVADAALKRIDLADGSVRVLASPVPVAFGGAWSQDGSILFSTNPGAPILRVSENGGEPAPATRFVSPQQRSQSDPRLLLDGHHFLFFVTGTAEARGVHLGQLDSLETKRLFDADGPAVQSAAGPLLFVRQGTLWAQEFDMDRLALVGEPVAVDTQVTAGTTLSASSAGPIAYRTPAADSGERQFVWIDRSGKELKKVTYSDTSATGPALSRDGGHLAVYRFKDDNMDIWSYGTERGTWDRLTFDPGDDINPVWSPNGAAIIFGSRRAGRMDLYRKVVGSPPGSEELVLSTPSVKFPMDWSSDGAFLLYNSIDAAHGLDIWALRLNGPLEPFAVVQTDYNEQLPQFSPNGKWIAYQSNRTGRDEIYLRPFPGPGNDVPISTQGGTQPRWTPNGANGAELFYVEPDARLMVVSIQFAPDSASFQLDRPRELFTGPIRASGAPRQQYVVVPDGKSFIVNTVAGQTMASPITVILNWKPPGRR